jgi:hypothetical protein
MLKVLRSPDLRVLISVLNLWNNLRQYLSEELIGRDLTRKNSKNESGI